MKIVSSNSLTQSIAALTREELLIVLSKQQEQLAFQAEALNLKEQTLKKQNTRIKELTTQLNWFSQQLALLKVKKYGKSSEKHSALQASLFDEDEDCVETEGSEKTDDNIIVPAHTRKKANRPNKHVDTSELPREEKLIDLTEAEKQCACGQCLTPFGRESKEEIIFVPPTLKVIEHIRIKYTCKACETVKTPPAVELPLLKSKVSAGLLAEIILAKYRFHLPFYRQGKVLNSHGLSVPVNTLAGWVMRSAEQLSPLREAFYHWINKVKLLQADETPVKVLKPEKKGYMWLYHCALPNQRFIFFEFNLSRSSDIVNERLKGFSGILQTDGYSGYASLRKRPDIISLGCWDHCRRKFTDVVKAAGNNKTGKAGKMLQKIATLYEIEREIKALPFDERRRVRQAESLPKLEAIYAFALKIHAPPQSLLGKAVTYLKNQWPTLIRYVDHGEAEISNCLIENQVRPFAVGKRNWLFVGNEASAQKAALLYSLIQSCELNAIDPRKYLITVLKQVHRMRRKEVDPMTLLPHTIDPVLLT